MERTNHLSFRMKLLITKLNFEEINQIKKKRLIENVTEENNMYGIDGYYNQGYSRSLVTGIRSLNEAK